ncbi:Uncharacterized membrane protein YeiB [Kytococcus aerolatus]|uniref:Uncharacterized membrane protein YeiB n=1 Tax=Kytococcus aerolatus TaxID=592308 RepID=A0A212T8K9_9MICO|nr:heparan-alpha-glucosaminide N-acetyltransferase domain-containing protein [Kytococcus aerolatus]SNC62362.1 Uncharacterized membrane protein YeiB [Kytococcus aerolatus]
MSPAIRATEFVSDTATSFDSLDGPNTGLSTEVVPDIPHACEPAGRATPEDQGPTEHRLTGLDAARGLALLGMISVHIFPAFTPEITVHPAWTVASGTASALFAVLAGVSLALMSGGSRPLSRGRWTPMLRQGVRAILILAIGLIMGLIIPVDAAGVILPYLAALFALAIPFLGLRARPLFVLAAVGAVLGPVLSYWLRQGDPVPNLGNLVPGDLFTRPLEFLETLVVTGLFPALSWLPYILLGMGIGRLRLRRRISAVHLALAGVAVTALSWVVYQVLTGPLGALEHVAEGQMAAGWTLDETADLLVWGPDGTVPTTSWWWLSTIAPHSGTPVDLLRTSGVALLVIGVMLGLGTLLSRSLLLLTAPGRMTLTLYCLHLLMLLLPLETFGVGVEFALQVLVVVVFALAWLSVQRQGPLEWLVGHATRALVPAGRGTRPAAADARA